MRKIIALLLLAATADAAPWIKDGLWFDRIPNPLPMGNGFAKFDPSEADFIATGARLPTQEEIDAREAQRQADQAAAEAAATLPATFPTGIAVTNEAGHWVEFIPDGTNVVCETLAIQISHSPLTPEQRNQMRQDAVATREAKRAEAKAAKKNGKLQDRIAALEALLGVE